MMTEEKKIDIPASAPKNDAGSAATPAALRDLVEKNLKWSQIIYEQNRRISRILLWGALARWLVVLLLAAPLVAGAIFLPPLIKRFIGSYGNLFNGTKALNGVKTGSGATPATAADILRLLPLNPAQREQLKAIVK